MVNRIKKIRDNVTLLPDTVANPKSTDYPGEYSGYNDAYIAERFVAGLKISVIDMDKRDMEFDLVGVDAAIANALRRILIAEVPTMAIEKVIFRNNTGILKDEVLASRLGLVALNVDASDYKFPHEEFKAARAPEDFFHVLRPDCNLNFNLKVKCTRKPKSKGVHNLNDACENRKIYSGAIQWEPITTQDDTVQEPIRPVHDDIIITKLAPGQEIDMQLIAVKGVGKDHSKFSPVSLASYRLLPEITLLRRVTGSIAYQLQKCFAPGVIAVERNQEGLDEAYVADARRDTCTREVFRHPHLRDLCEISKRRQHFIFSIESTSFKSPDELFLESVSIFKSKCQNLLKELDASEGPDDDEEEMDQS